ncbi:tyrosine-protein phosphatase [Lentibacillus sp. CBA3610]|uniref:tyrosine-protein phosphatase n=1 Tax=Lentibacillus sp. CBA3610 TaxID=2518176 RepID=UPI001595973D|nr:CpsB/CapC family capsule biosynthesis tyrosine phosphatase [Lentibacillus sp. CBA3610]QKY70316.1 tyrosine protein phosphatase [Lentibacillus sp. CBA3610]
MIDIHCHILPGLDDGPKLLKKTIAMAKKAADQGIDTIIATPHHNNGKYINERQDILGATDFVNAQIQQHGIPVDIVPGQEIHLYEDIAGDLKRGLLLPLNQSSKYVLIELPETHLPPYTHRLIFDLQRDGYIPVLAHPERNASIAENPNILYDLVKNGAAVQADAASVIGTNGKKVKKLTQQLLDANMVHIIASNAHDAKTIHLAKAYRSLEATMSDMFIENSGYIFHDKPIAKEMPERIRKSRVRKFF